MEHIYTAILSQMESKQPAVLVSVIRSSGSTPRTFGAQMLVAQKGILFGTIGGGIAEFKAIEQAQNCLKESRSMIQSFVLKQDSERNLDSVCGGEMEAAFSYIAFDDPNWKSAAQNACKLIEKHNKGFLLLSDHPKIITEQNNNSEQPILPLPFQTHCIIFGAGHCAVALCALLKTVDFRIDVFDDRKELLTAERFQAADNRICGSFNELFEKIEIKNDDFVVVMTSGHHFDFDVLRQVLAYDPAYIGCIGSENKAMILNQRLKDAGLSDIEIEKIHSPIGLKISADTPAEIAVSVAAEMIQIRAEKFGNTKKLHNS